MIWRWALYRKETNRMNAMHFLEARIAGRQPAIRSSGRVSRATAGLLAAVAISGWAAAASDQMVFQLAPISEATDRAASPRHAAAQSAGTRALHLCTGYFSTEAPRELIDAIAGTNVLPIAPASARTEVDEQARTVSVYFDQDMPPRIAVARPVVGCTLLPIGMTRGRAASLTRPDLKRPKLDDAAWPTGDRNAQGQLSPGQQASVERLLDEAFKGEKGAYSGTTWGVLVVKDGKIVAERYQYGFGPHVSARTNSMCKSLSATVVGVGVQQGLLDLHKKPLLAVWRGADDPRGEISLDNLLHMSSGLYTESAGDRQNELYMSGALVAETAALNIVDARPGTRFVYAGADTQLAMRALHEAVGHDAEYLVYPYRELLWKIGMTHTLMETDANNDFLSSGQCWSTARDFGRLGLLYLADGTWNGQRLLPVGWSKYVSTPASPQSAGRRSTSPQYGAQFWTYGGISGLPLDAYAPVGARGQYAMIIPSKQLVVVRRGFDDTAGFQIAKFAADIVGALGD
jgi:CubicO group peptidase (beta-lactamase class C family)